MNRVAVHNHWRGSDASLAQKFLETIEESVDEDIATIGIPEFDEEDCDDGITTRARVHTPQGSVAEELSKDYSVQELSSKFKISASKLEGTNLGNPSWRAAIRLGDAAKRRTDKRIKKGCVVWIPIPNYKASRGELSELHTVESIKDKRIKNGITEYLVQWEPITKLVTTDGVENVQVEEFEDSWRPEGHLNCRRSVQEYEDDQASSIGTSK